MLFFLSLPQDARLNTAIIMTIMCEIRHNTCRCTYLIYHVKQKHTSTVSGMYHGEPYANHVIVMTVQIGVPYPCSVCLLLDCFVPLV